MRGLEPSSYHFNLRIEYDEGSHLEAGYYQCIVHYPIPMEEGSTMPITYYHHLCEPMCQWVAREIAEYLQSPEAFVKSWIENGPDNMLKLRSMICDDSTEAEVMPPLRREFKLKEER